MTLLINAIQIENLFGWEQSLFYHYNQQLSFLRGEKLVTKFDCSIYDKWVKQNE